MRAPGSLQARLGLLVGLGLALVWAVTVLAAGGILSARMNAVADSALQETAQRILPLAVTDIIERDQDGLGRRIASLRPHDELLTYVVRDAQGRVLLTSHNADPADFPPYTGPGFRQTATQRLYYDAALQGNVTIAVAEPLALRAAAARRTLLALAVPLLGLVPLSLLGVWLIVRRTIRPVADFGASIATRGAGDLTPLPADALPDELIPVAEAVNQLLGRLRRTIEAERSFTANAAHELRTPLAAALAQTQRLLLEAPVGPPRDRASEIEATLKRLARLSEKLMQLARAEGGRMRADAPVDAGAIVAVVADEFRAERARLQLTLPPAPALTAIDADALAILTRNLIENALAHGSPGAPVGIALTEGAVLTVRNAGPVIPAAELARLSDRFARGNTTARGSGLGLSIVRTIAEGSGGALALVSPAPGGTDGLAVQVTLPPAERGASPAAGNRAH